MALVVLDSSAVIAFLDPDDALHDAAVEALTEHQHDELLLPTSAYAEILVAPHRRGAEAVAEVEAFLADFLNSPRGADPGDRAGGGKAPERVPEPAPSDALVLATADEVDADTVLTGDESGSRISDRVRLIQRN